MNNQINKLLRILIISVVIFNLNPVFSAPYNIVHTGVLKTFSDLGEIAPGPGAYPFRGQDSFYVRNLPSYRELKNGVIYDNITGLYWAKNMPPKLNFEEAKNHVNYMNQTAYAGRRDWRIPSVKELYSLIKFDGEISGETYVGKPFIDTRFFNQPIGNKALGERDIDAQNWTSSRYVSKVMVGFGPGFEGQDAFFGVNFIDGRIKGYPYMGPGNVPAKYYLRAVAGNPLYGKNDFLDLQNGVIHDRATNLMWQKFDIGQPVNWQTGLAYCEDLNFAGFSDWRLPSIKELHSIVDYSRAPAYFGTLSSPAISPIFGTTSIINPRQGVYYAQYPFFWSATTHIENPQKKGDHAAYMAFGEAIGYFSPVPNAPAQVIDVHGAGAQRSDAKSGIYATQYFGPQGDISYAVGNYVRCVRYAS